MKKTIGYLRVSTVKQLDGAGPDQQRAVISAWALATKTMIDEFMVDAANGDNEDRPKILELKEMARKGELECVIVDRLDRFARDALVSELLYRFFKAHDVRVIAVSQSFDDSSGGTAMRQMFAVIAQLDKANRITHLRQCRQATVERHGTFGGGNVPYGYETTGSGQLKLVPGETKLIIRAFELRDHGNTQSQISAILRQEGFRTRKGTEFTPKQVARILGHEAQYRAKAPFGTKKLDDGVQVAHPAVLK